MKKKENLHHSSNFDRYLYLEHSFQRFFITTSRGFEDILKEEIEEITSIYQIKSKIWNGSAGCYLESSWSGGIAVNLASMCASRVLLVLLEDEVQNEEDIYNVSRKIDWSFVFNKSLTFSVNASVNDSFINNSMYVGLKVKDAICDSFYNKYKERPSVNTENPDVKIFIRLFRNKLSISVDTTGVPLSQRGYRVQTVEAPLRESLAASLLRISGWNLLANKIWHSSEAVYFEDKETRILNKNLNSKKVPTHLLSPFLLDPMCGSGTFVIEAALSLLHWKPNVHRNNFTFLNLCPNYSKEINASFRVLKTKIIANEKSISELPLRIKLYAEKNNIDCQKNHLTALCGSDYLESNIRTARECAKVAGVSNLVSFSKQDVFESAPHSSHGFLIVNPPYGERLEKEKDLTTFYRSLGDLWKQQYPNWMIWLLSGSEDGIKSVGLRATRRISVYNGNIQCKFLQYLMYPRVSKSY